MPSIADTLRREIERSDQTLNALAQAVGVSQPSLWRFVHQNKDRNLETVEKLLAHFGYVVVKKGGRANQRQLSGAESSPGARRKSTGSAKGRRRA